MAARALAGAQKGALAEGRTIVFVDQSGFRLLPSVVRTYAPKGQTPLIRRRQTHDHLSAMGAITPAGQLLLSIQDHAYKGPDVVRCLKHLLRQVPGKLLVVWDGAPIHRGQAVKDFLAQGAAARLRLVQLPGYAPELNPAEGIWHYLKDVELKNVVCADLPGLRQQLVKATKRLRHKRDILQGFVRQPGYV